MAKVEAKLEGKGKAQVLVLRIPVQEPTPSASGKTLVVATSNGNQPVDCEFEGKQLIVGLNAYYRKER